MRLGVIGAGAIGGTVARLAVKSGHEVWLANSRGPDSLMDIVAALGDGAVAATVGDAATSAEVVIEALPFGQFATLPQEFLAGKVVVSASNYYAARDGVIDLGGRIDTEMVAEHLTRSRVVKAFNTIWSEHLATQGDRSLPMEDRRVIFTAGDDESAVRTVGELIEGFGFAAYNTGSLHEGGRRQSPSSPLYNRDITLAEARRVIEQTDGGA